MRDSNFKVFVRCRTKERAAPLAYEVASSTDLVRKDVNKRYSFDRVFGAEQSQEAVFETCALPLVDEFLRGYNGTMFAYGQTGTGKTYTMTGDCESADSRAAGIVPRVLHSVFRKLEDSQRDEWSLELRYVELYNEELRDLLDPTPPTTKQRGAKQLRIGENQLTRSTEVFGATSHAVTSCASALAVIRSALARRHTAATLLNSDSSRSHTVLTLVLVVREPVSGMAVRSKLHLVDLAGSESVAKSGALRQRAVEAGEINKSLLALGRVIEALVDAEKTANGKPRYVSYRASKLTQLLQDSLGGATKTSMVATVSIASQDADETRSTLDYALRARSIKNQQQTEVELLDTLPTIKEMSRRLEEVQRELTVQRTRDGCVCIPTARYEQLTAGEQKAAKLLAQHETATRHQHALLDQVQHENARLESQLAALAAEHRTCSNTALSNTRFQTAISALTQVAQKQASIATGTCESMFANIGDLSSRIAAPIAELRAVLESQVFFSAATLKNTCESNIHSAVQAQSAECQAAVSALLETAGAQLTTTLNNAMIAWQKSVQDLQRPFNDAATLTAHLADQLDDIQRCVAQEQAANSEAVALARDLMAREHKHTQALQQLQEASQDRIAITRRLISSGKESNAKLPQLSARTTSAGQCAANIQEVLTHPMPKSEPNLVETASLELAQLSNRVPKTLAQQFEQLEDNVTARMGTEFALNDERIGDPQRSHLSAAAQAFMGLQQDIDQNLRRYKPEITGFTTKNASLQHDIAKLLQQVQSVPSSPLRGGTRVRSPVRSPARSPYRNARRVPSLDDSHKENSSTSVSEASSRPGSGPGMGVFALSRPSSKDGNPAVLQDIGNQVNARLLRNSDTPKLVPSVLQTDRQRMPNSRAINSRAHAQQGAARTALHRPPQRGASPLQKRVKRQDPI